MEYSERLFFGEVFIERVLEYAQRFYGQARSGEL